MIPVPPYWAPPLTAQSAQAQAAPAAVKREDEVLHALAELSLTHSPLVAARMLFAS